MRLFPLLLFAALSLAFAPAPFPKPERRPEPQVMAGAWDVKWADMDARLDLRPDGSARFVYVKMEGGWDGSWKYDGARKVTLTLLFDGNPHDYVLTFSAVGRDSAEGSILDTPTSSRPLKLARSGRK